MPPANVAYQATGLATYFKEQSRNHKASFQHDSKRNETEISEHIWTLKDDNKPFHIKWKVCTCSNISKKCDLCLYEKFVMIFKKRSMQP